MAAPEKHTDTGRAGLEFSRPSEDALLAQLSGRWVLGNELPAADRIREQIGATPPVKHLSFDTAQVEEWDTGLVSFVLKVHGLCTESGLEMEPAGLPEGVGKLLQLATAVPPKKDARKEKARPPFLARVGEASLGVGRSSLEMLSFLGEAVLAFLNLLRGKARYRKVDLFLTLQEVGPKALPIVSLISFLVGMILAFVGAVQLQQFGAQIYIANLVGLGMAREMGAMMAAIIMAGRTGAAFAAQLGTMQVNEEIDAYRTLGISPMEFLVLPRMLALMLMMPLLTLYADLLGILGGAVVGVGMMDLGVIEYFKQTQAALGMNDFAVGLFKGAVFGVLVAIAGCMRGMQSGRSSAAVGIAATSAVVTGIVFIIVSDSLITVIFTQIGI